MATLKVNVITEYSHVHVDVYIAQLVKTGSHKCMFWFFTRIQMNLVV